MGAAMRYQPQGLARLDRSNPLVAGAQAIISAAHPANLVSQSALVAAGTVNRAFSPVGKAILFRKNGYVETESLAAVGTASFVEFWYGYPSSDLGTKGGGTETQFVTGQSANQMGIATTVGLRGGSASGQWGYVNAWSNLSPSGDVVVPGQLSMLIVVRRQTSLEFWRNGLKVASVPTGSPTSYPAGTMICGSFVEDTGYWPSSSDTILAGRILGEWSPDQVRAFSANPWQIFTSGSSSSVYQAAIGSSGGAPGGLKSFSYSASGGVVFGGSAPRVRSVSRAPVGSLAITGSGQAVRGAAKVAQGGMLFSGAAPTSFHAAVQSRVVSAAGGLLIRGAAVLVRAWRRLASGGITWGGTSTAVVTASAPPAAALFCLSTLMRADVPCAHAAISNAAINRTANLL